MSQSLIGGVDDPLKIALSGSEYQILDLVIQPRSDNTDRPKDEFTPLHIFAKTNGEVDSKRATALLSYLQAASGAPDLTVILRRDHWFVNACDFPLLFLFDGVPLRIPTRVEVETAKQAVCVALKQWPVRCY